MSDRMVIVLDLPWSSDRPERLGELATMVKDALARGVTEEEYDGAAIRLGIRGVADEVIAVFEREEDEMGIVKHGEGNVLPESDEQATKQGSKEGLSKEEFDAIQAEGQAADDDVRSSDE